MADLLETFGVRPIALCRELTKLHEETIRTTLAQAVDFYRDNEPKGEFVLVLAGAQPEEGSALTLEEGVSLVLRKRMAGLGMKEAVRQVAADTGLSRKDLYAAALQQEDS